MGEDINSYLDKVTQEQLDAIEIVDGQMRIKDSIYEWDFDTFPDPYL